MLEPILEVNIEDNRSEISWNQLMESFSPPNYLSLKKTLEKIKTDHFNEEAIMKLFIENKKENTFKADLRNPKIVELLAQWNMSTPNLAELTKDAYQTYYFLEYIKSLGDTTYPLDSIPVRRHLSRMKSFLRPKMGEVLDIGCNSPFRSRFLYDKEVTYLGCDPFLTDQPGSMVCCFAEELPFKVSSFDVTVFNTSLDHILDYHEAIKEAWRVTRAGGSIIISGYSWRYAATLLKDHVHFHHFREDQLKAALLPFGNLTRIERYTCPKKDNHRYLIYMDCYVMK